MNHYKETIRIELCALSLDTLLKLTCLVKILIFAPSNDFGTIVNGLSVLKLFHFRMAIYYFRRMPTAATNYVKLE